MGSGEPLANYENTVKFLRLLREYGMSLRGVSLSTCGLTERMRALAQEDLPVTLCVSLHAPNDEIRRRIMPIARKYAMDDVIDACREFIARTGRRVIFEYALIENVNCSLACADELAARLRGLMCHVNLIPLNPVKERALRAPSLQEQNAFLHRLEQKKISVTRRRALGSEIEGACGQLRRARLSEEKEGLTKKTGGAKPMKAYAITNTGRVRAMNEDAYYLPGPGEHFAAVADGMGGHLAGEVASAMAIELFARRMRAARGLPEDTLRDALECANMAIYHAAARDADKRGMGTTFTAVWMGEGEAYLAHVGDSRAYLLRDGRLLRVSRDHTLVEELVAHGHLTREQAKTYPHRNYITRALGVNATVQPDILRLDWLEGDVWLLCSDGLTNEVEEADIERVLKGAGEYGEKLSRIVRMALEHGGRDNITGVLVTTEED